MNRFLQFTEWYQPFLRKGDSEPTQLPMRQNSIPIDSIRNICSDAENPSCSLIWVHSDREAVPGFGGIRPHRASESVEELTRRINGA